jgi:1-acyl-sn-glycerol-3-phosphate acyltransferase
MELLDELRKRLIQKTLSAEDQARVDQAMHRLNSAGFDPWGLDPNTLKTSLALMSWLYTDYFRVEVSGIDRLPQGRMLLIANHGGQLPIDGILVGLSMILKANPPRVVRGMVERWAQILPFVSTFFSRVGQMVGDSRNCRDLLEHDECVLAFPEGVSGSGKTIQQKYQLQKFGTGFMRLALETRSPIVPVAVIGCEETYPAFYNFKSLAKLLRAPYIPITPLFPFFGALGAIPLPTKVTIRFGEPLSFEGDPDASDLEIEKKIDVVREALEREIQSGLKIRGDQIFTKSAVDPKP